MLTNGKMKYETDKQKCYAPKYNENSNNFNEYKPTAPNLVVSIS